MAYRVIVWGTGFVGKMVLKEILDHPDWDLVGVIVHSPEKNGVDVGELLGRAPIGLRATSDIDAALAVPADAVAYYGPTAAHAAANVENIAKALAAGKNVVSTAMSNWVYYKSAPRAQIEPIEKACREGGVSCFTTGIDPGFANDLLPLTLMGLCGRIDSVRIQEILDYSTYSGSIEGMGIGRPPEEVHLLENRDILVMAWGGTIPMMAEAIDVELDDIDIVYEKWPARERIEYPYGVIEPGAVAAVRFEIRGIIGGEPRIVIEHVNRITHAAAPHWPRTRIEENDCYRVIIKGSPDITQETAFRGEKGDPNAGGCLATGLRALGAIPAVCAAEPGLLTALDLPLIPGRHNLR